MARWTALLVAILDTAAWLFLCAFTFLSQSDPATKGLDQLAGMAGTVLFLLTGAPALMLAWRGRAPRFALFLALCFPAAFAVLFVMAAMA